MMQQHRNSNSAMESGYHFNNRASSKSQKSRGCFLYYLLFAVLAVPAALTSCGDGNSNNSSGKIKMTTEESRVEFGLTGNGVVMVDWGDGSEKVPLTLNRDGVIFDHTYPTALMRTITISGNNITGLECFSITGLDVSRCTELTFLQCRGSFTSLDVSKNTALKQLVCSSNQLTSLDVSKNRVLTVLYCRYCQFSATALNALFRTLHSNTIQGETKTITIYDNPGTEGCNRSIAEAKGWMVE